MSSLLALDSEVLMSWMGRFWWPFVRTATLLLSMPVFDSINLPARARVLFAAFLSLLVASTDIAIPQIDPFSIEMPIVVIEQVLFGIVMGLMLRILFTVFTISGQLLSMQMGLSMAVMMDPGSGQTPLVGQLFWLMTSMLFFAIDGHLMVLAILSDSFQLWPVGSSLYDLDLWLPVKLFGWMFGAGLLISLPAIVVMLLINIVFGVASRAAPSLNIFVLGFPMSLLTGFVAILLVVQQVGGYFFKITEEVLTSLQALMA